MTDPVEALNHYYIKTIHHEFTHILNQTKDFPVEFSMITGSGYVADSWNEEPYESEHLKYGFITDYAQHSEDEDFAEMLSEYVTHSQEWWDKQIEEAGDAGQYIEAKKAIVISIPSTSTSMSSGQPYFVARMRFGRAKLFSTVSKSSNYGRYEYENYKDNNSNSYPFGRRFNDSVMS